MKFNKRHCLGELLHQCGLVIVVSIVFVATSCTTTSEPVKMEARSFTKRLGLQGCRASIPLDPSEAVEIGRKWEIYPNPEKDPEWIEMNAMRQPGDELRLISCSSGDPYFYALIRNNSVVFKYHLPVVD